MTQDTPTAKARAVGINHVALEVGDIDEALEFYGKILAFSLRGRGETSAFIGMGDQFIALFKGGSGAKDTGRHFGLVVDDPAKVRRALEDIGVEIMPGPGLDFLDPWGNFVQIVNYEKIQFMKTPAVLRAMGLDDLEKTAEARREIAEKGFAAD
ncbi:MAG: VOC family protein [Proteobacteria bacterium]|nr:VOC family protein [Pseudomonadota bacterium]